MPTSTHQLSFFYRRSSCSISSIDSCLPAFVLLEASSRYLCLPPGARVWYLKYILRRKNEGDRLRHCRSLVCSCQCSCLKALKSAAVGMAKVFDCSSIVSMAETRYGVRPSCKVLLLLLLLTLSPATLSCCGSNLSQHDPCTK